MSGAVIRPIGHADAAELFALVDANRVHLRRWLPWLDGNRSMADTAAFITASLHGYADRKSLTCCIIDQGRIGGICGFNAFNHAIKAGYIGYWIAATSSGKGLVTAACRELERIGFAEYGLNKIEIHAAVGNARSRAVAERLGYRQTGTLCDAEWLYDHYVDHVIYCRRVGESRGPG